MFPMAFPVELGLILLFSILGGVLAVRFRQPSVLGLIIIGVIVGPYNLGIVKDTSLINASIEIGAILLLFTVGVEFSLQKLLNLVLSAVVIAVVKRLLVPLYLSYKLFCLAFCFAYSLCDTEKSPKASYRRAHKIQHRGHDNILI